MVSSSKILTVSYGTFSCTAEGFEDPLAAVKDATRFYQGVVREDRFFGSEPPQLDAEMAEQMMSQQIAAEGGANGLMLRPAFGLPAAASFGALNAALAAGPSRAAAAPAPVSAEADDVAGNAEAEAPEDAMAEDTEGAASGERFADDPAEIPSEIQAEIEEGTPAEIYAKTHPVEQSAEQIPEPETAETDVSEPDTMATDDADVAHGPETDVAQEGVSIEEFVAHLHDASEPEPADAALAVEEVMDPAEADAVADKAAAETSVSPVAGDVAPEALSDEMSTDEPAAHERAADEAVAEAGEVDAAGADREKDEDTGPEDVAADAETSTDADHAALHPISEDTIAAIADMMAENGATDDPVGDKMAAVLSEEDDSPVAQEPTAQPPAQAPVGSLESVAAKLKRIRAVVARARTPAAPVDAAPEPEVYSEDEHANEVHADGYVAFDMAGVRDAVSAPAPAEDMRKAEEQAEDVSDEEYDDNLFADTIDAVADRLSASDDVESAASDVTDLAGSMVRTAEQVVPDPRPEPEPPQSETAPVAAAQPQRRTRVIKVKRADFDAAVAAGQLEAIDDHSKDSPSSSLSPEEEEELARELAAVEAELDADDWDEDEEDWPVVDAARSHASPKAEPLRLENAFLVDETDTWDDAEEAHEADDTAFEDDPEGDDTLDEAMIDAMAREGARKAVKLSSPARVMLTENRIEEDDTSVDRILDETNTQLEEPEGNRRRSAIAHLRAAVAATRADRLLGRKKDPEEEFEPYREDLASVVRPRRPQTTPLARSERPRTDVRPAPLKLVAEQRVDETPAPQTTPIRPRRIRTTDLDTALGEDIPEAADGGFAAYAEDMGATDLSDLLEAAASYMAFVEGRDQFSRPQLMTKVRQVEAMESSREERLRSFGQLLREGKIEKTRAGRFTASDSISFKPKARAAG